MAAVGVGRCVREEAGRTPRSSEGEGERREDIFFFKKKKDKSATIRSNRRKEGEKRKKAGEANGQQQERRRFDSLSCHKMAVHSCALLALRKDPSAPLTSHTPRGGEAECSLPALRKAHAPLSSFPPPFLSPKVSFQSYYRTIPGAIRYAPALHEAFLSYPLGLYLKENI